MSKADGTELLARSDVQPLTGLLRRTEVETLIGLSRASIYRLMAEGVFPKPIKIGQSAVRWRIADLTAYLESLNQGQTNSAAQA